MSASNTAPTASAGETHAGHATPVVQPPLPAESTTRTPASSRLWNACRKSGDSVSQLPVEGGQALAS